MLTPESRSLPLPRRFRTIAGILSTTVLLLMCLASACAQPQEEQQEWITLFNGQDLDDWIVKINHHDVGVNYGNTFRITDGILQVRYDHYGNFNEQFGHLYYKQPYSYFRLVVEYRFQGELHQGAPSYTLRNSGIMFHSQDPRTMPQDQNWPISVEMQFLGGLGDGNPRPTGNMCSPGTDVIYDGQIDPRHCIESSSETYDGDQWVQAEAIVLGDSLVTHLINGKPVLQYTSPQIGGNVVVNYDPAQKQDGKLLKEGFIALQSEGQGIDFRKVELLNLEGCMDPNASNYKSYYIKSDPSQCQ